MDDRPTRVLLLSHGAGLAELWSEAVPALDGYELIERTARANQVDKLLGETYPDVLILVNHSLRGTRAILHTLRQASWSPPCIAVLSALDVPLLRSLMALGVQDALAMTQNPTDLRASIEALLARRQAALSPLPPPHPLQHQRGTLIVVYGPKGGVGKTTIATNLAIALREESGQEVVLADFNLQFGDAGIHLDLRSRHALHELFPTEIDRRVMRDLVQPHGSGIRLLLAPEHPESLAYVSSALVEGIVDQLLQDFSFVVADTWSCLDGTVTERLLRLADHVLLVLTPDLAALKHAKHFLGYARRTGLIPGALTIVLNRFPDAGTLNLETIQEHLHETIDVNIPSEGALVTSSINFGIPLVLAEPHSQVAQSIFRLAGRLAGEPVETLVLT